MMIRIKTADLIRIPARFLQRLQLVPADLLLFAEIPDRDVRVFCHDAFLLSFCPPHKPTDGYKTGV